MKNSKNILQTGRDKSNIYMFPVEYMLNMLEKLIFPVWHTPCVIKIEHNKTIRRK